jgi:hypothetical protein
MILLLPAGSARADSCNNPDAVQAAIQQLANSLDISDPSQLSLDEIQPNTLTDGTPVCTGKLSNPKFSTISVWNVSYESGEPIVTVLQAMTPAATTLNGDQSNAAVQQQQDQEAAAVQANQQLQEQQSQQQQQQRNSTSLGSLLFGNGLNALLKGQ